MTNGERQLLVPDSFSKEYHSLSSSNLSPDLRQIAIVGPSVKERDEILSATGNLPGKGSAIVRVAPVGGPLKVLWQSAESMELGGHWSPDGKYLLLLGTSRETAADSLARVRRYHTIGDVDRKCLVILDMDGKARIHPLPQNVQWDFMNTTRWTPDGKHLLLRGKTLETAADRLARLRRDRTIGDVDRECLVIVDMNGKVRIQPLPQNSTHFTDYFYCGNKEAVFLLKDDPLIVERLIALNFDSGESRVLCPCPPKFFPRADITISDELQSVMFDAVTPGAKADDKTQGLWIWLIGEKSPFRLRSNDPAGDAVYRIGPVAISANGKYVIGAFTPEGEVKHQSMTMWSTATRKPLWTIKERLGTDSDWRYSGFAFDPAGKRVCISSGNKMVISPVEKYDPGPMGVTIAPTLPVIHRDGSRTMEAACHPRVIRWSSDGKRVLYTIHSAGYVPIFPER